MRVLVADDSVLFREGLVRLLEDSGIEVVAQTGHTNGLVDLVSQTGVDLVILDIRMPPTHTIDGLVAASALRAANPNLSVVLLSQYIETRYAMDLLADGTGGVGYLLKDRVADIDEFLDALHRVARGGTVIDPLVVSRIFARERRHDPLGELTDREREVLALMAEGRSNQAIADRLIVHVRTVETHVSSVLSKLGIGPEPDDHRRVRAVLLYLDHSNRSDS
jgi:DNA-binding NarL/FixJ family response regulator